MALHRADKVVVSIFVNPKQFGPREDFSRYPRQEAEDAHTLARARAHLIFAPKVEEMYPAGFATTVSVAGVSAGRCGGARPGIFDGVSPVDPQQRGRAPCRERGCQAVSTWGGAVN